MIKIENKDQYQAAMKRLDRLYSILDDEDAGTATAKEYSEITELSDAIAAYESNLRKNNWN